MKNKPFNYRPFIKAFEIALLLIAVIACCAVLSTGQLPLTYTLLFAGFCGVAIGWMLVEIKRELQRGEE